jgi:hypothetical protein
MSCGYQVSSRRFSAPLPPYPPEQGSQ